MNIADIKKGDWCEFNTGLKARYLKTSKDEFHCFDMWVSGGKLGREPICLDLEKITKIYKDEIPIIAGEWYVIAGRKWFIHGKSVSEDGYLCETEIYDPYDGQRCIVMTEEELRSDGTRFYEGGKR